ncbi:MAG: hypothetical protein ACE5JN_05220 [Candidatus Methylomirabilia bacterium]
MTTWAIVAIAGVLLAVVVVLIPTLLAVRRAAIRAETVLGYLEREIRPTARQLQTLAEEVGSLSRQAGRELERVASRVDELSRRIGMLVGVVSSLTRVGQIVTAASGVRRGVNVFLSRLRSNKT